MNADTYRDAFRLLLAQGKSPLEAMREFDDETFKSALRESIDDGDRTLLTLAGMAWREEMNENDLDLAMELWAAGWSSETLSGTQADIFSWYWRRPPIGKRPKGRLFLSTNQAINALRKEGKS